MLDALTIMAAVLYILLAYLFVRKYLRTRNPGFIWLGIAFILWPIAELFLNAYVRHLVRGWINGHPANWILSLNMTPGTLYAYSAVTQRIGLLVLLIFSVYYLSNRKIEAREALT